MLGDFEDMSQTCPMSCPMSSNFNGQDIEQSQLRGWLHLDCHLNLTNHQFSPALVQQNHQYNDPLDTDIIWHPSPRTCSHGHFWWGNPQQYACFHDSEQSQPHCHYYWQILALPSKLSVAIIFCNFEILLEGELTFMDVLSCPSSLVTCICSCWWKQKNKQNREKILTPCSTWLLPLWK